MSTEKRIRTSLCNKLFYGYYQWYVENRNTLEKIFLAVHYNRLKDCEFMESGKNEQGLIYLDLSIGSVGRLTNNPDGLVMTAVFGEVERTFNIPWESFFSVQVVDIHGTGFAQVFLTGNPPFEFEVDQGEIPPPVKGKPTLTVVR